MKHNVLMGGKNSGAVMIEGLGLYVPMSQVRSLQAEVERLCTANLDSVSVCEQALQAKVEAEQERDQLKAEIAHLQIEVTNLRGLKPEIPPLPGEDWPKELPRYILRENGSHRPRSVPHKDGYWTPWYLANRLYAELERERKAAKTACENWGEMKQERDQLAVEVEALTPYRDNHHDLIRHMAEHDAEVIERFLATEAPRIDAGGPNPIDPELHHCEWALHQERERLHAADNQLRQQAKAQPGNDSCELECGAHGTYCRCRAEKAKEVHSGGN